tara:strand:+ start:554 stop:736 length:183 start_codon:yes stop_codon:yes gene_type:complete
MKKKRRRTIPLATKARRNLRYPRAYAPTDTHRLENLERRQMLLFFLLIASFSNPQPKDKK